MKKGDIVQITDGSWTQSVVNRALVKEFLNSSHDRDEYGPVQNRKYIIIETGCSFPLVGGDAPQPSYYRNDTVIQDTKSGKVVFIHHGFLKLVKPKRRIAIDVQVTRLGGIYGNVIEISDDLYQEIKNEQAGS